MISKKAFYMPLILLLSSTSILTARRYGRTQAQPAQQYNRQTAYQHQTQTQAEPDDSYNTQEAQMDQSESANGSITEINSNQELQEALNNPSPTVIYCTADWCEACTKYMEPVISKAADKYGNRISFRKLNYDKFKKQSDKLGVDGLPRTLFRRDGKQITMKGSRPEAYFMGQCEQFINNRMQPEQESVSTPRAATSGKRKNK